MTEQVSVHAHTYKVFIIWLLAIFLGSCEIFYHVM